LDNSLLSNLRVYQNEVNWEKWGYMGPVNIQGPGDCWANSAAGALESALAVKEKRKVGQ